MSNDLLGAKDLATAVTIAEELGVHKATVNRIARNNAIGTFLGNQRVFTKQEAKKIKRMCNMKKGNPNFSKKV